MTTITPAQSRAARAFLGWSRADMAKVTGISPETIQNFETGVFQARQSTIEKVIWAFEEHGLDLSGGGVRPRVVAA
jgi:predicted transcriptional regulator